MQLRLQGIKAARIIWIVCIYLYCCSEAASPFVCVSISFLDWSCTWKKCFKPFKGQDFTWLGVFCKWLLNPFAVLELSLPLALQAAGLECARLPISVAHQMFTHRDGPCKEGRRKSSFRKHCIGPSGQDAETWHCEELCWEVALGNTTG